MKSAKTIGASVADAEKILELPERERPAAYDLWQQKTADFVERAFGSDRRAEFVMGTILLPESLEHRCSDRLYEQVELLRRWLSETA